MKKFFLISFFLCVNGLYAFDNQAQISAFENIIFQNHQTLQKMRSLCLQDKLYLGEFAEKCYAIAEINTQMNVAQQNANLKDRDSVKFELKEDLELMKKACAITLSKYDGCVGFLVYANFNKERLNLSDDYVSENLKQRGFEYLSKACDKEYSIFQSKAKNKNSINGFYVGKTCLALAAAYNQGIGTLRYVEKALFYQERACKLGFPFPPCN